MAHLLAYITKFTVTPKGGCVRLYYNHSLKMMYTNIKENKGHFATHFTLCYSFEHACKSQQT